MRVRPATEDETALTRPALFGDIFPRPGTEQFQCAHCDVLLAAPKAECFNLSLAFVCPLCHNPSVSI